MADVVSFPTQDLEIEIDQTIAGEVDVELPFEPLEVDSDPPVPAASQAIVSTALIEVLPADFPLPRLARFVPNQALKTAVGETVRALLAIDVTSTDGLQRADVLNGTLADQLKGIDAHFEDPASIAYELHRHITGLRADFKREGLETQKVMARRLFDEVERRNAIAREQARQDQAEADRRERERIAAEVTEAEVAQVPVEVIEELKQQAQTAKAAPVSRPTSAAAGLSRNTTTKTWRGRIAGTDGEEQPAMNELSAVQRAKVMETFKAVVEGRAPMAVFDINWSYVNSRAKSDKSAMGIPGFEAFQVGGTRTKGGRA